MKRAAPLTRKKPIKSKRAGKPRRVKATCNKVRCNRPAKAAGMCIPHARAECDRLLSLVVRSRGICCRCGATTNLQAAHLIRRGAYAVRWNEDNVFCLDAKCHVWSHAREVEWWSLVDEWHPGRREAMYRLAVDGLFMKLDYEAILADLRQRAASL